MSTPSTNYTLTCRYYVFVGCDAFLWAEGKHFQRLKMW